MEYAPFLTADASFDPATANDVLRSGQTISEVEIPVTMYYQNGILPNMHVQSPKGLYVIKGIINPQERDFLLILMCVGFGKNT